jgi:hypothetical protein
LKKIVLGLTSAALLASAATAAPANAWEPPVINCGIVSCTYPIERKLDTVDECVKNTVHAVELVLQGTPQPQECSIG